MTSHPSSTTLAFIYDFDGTLCAGNLMDQKMLRELLPEGSDLGQFWNNCNDLARREQADRVCTYMLELIRLSKASGRPLSRKMLAEYGAQGTLRTGLAGPDSWFERLASMCDEAGVIASHYIISSGLREMIASCLDARGLGGYFAGEDGNSHVFASRFFFDEDDFACAPAWTVNYTTKTQFVFRINKGKIDLGDEKAPNEFMPHAERPVPFKNMVFIGDGYSDIPCFSLIKEQGGFAMAVLDSDMLSSDTLRQKSLRQIETLVGDGRVDAIGLVELVRAWIAA